MTATQYNRAPGPVYEVRRHARTMSNMSKMSTPGKPFNRIQGLWLARAHVYTRARVRILDKNFRTKGLGVPDMASFAELKKNFSLRTSVSYKAS